jgi:hypothetical protein
MFTEIGTFEVEKDNESDDDEGNQSILRECSKSLEGQNKRFLFYFKGKIKLTLK